MAQRNQCVGPLAAVVNTLPTPALTALALLLLAGGAYLSRRRQTAG